MTGFLSSIPIDLFRGAEIEMIVVGASSLQFVLSRDRVVIFDYYGATEYKNDWLYNLPLCGKDSVQSLVGQSVNDIVVKSIDRVDFIFSEGKVLEITHDDVNADIMRFVIGKEEYIV